MSMSSESSMALYISTSGLAPGMPARMAPTNCSAISASVVSGSGKLASA